MKRFFKKFMCIFLAAIMLLGLFADCVPAAYAVSADDDLAPNGQTWEEAYPSGAFIFRESYLYTRECDDTVSIVVYRMGGREGRAEANLAITPLAPEGNTANAAGHNDFEVIYPRDIDIYPDSEFGTAFADLVFEDGEYVKSLEIQALDDGLSEPEELFVVTIYDAQGAEFIEDANRFTACIQDNDPYVESQVYFPQKMLSFDKSGGSAVLEVARSGGTQYVFSVDYETVSESAVAGADFVHTAGTLLFNCGEETAAIEIPLINDNVETEEAERSFAVVLSNPKGGSIVDGAGEARISLYNSATKGAVMNIATLVTDAGAIDISAKAVISAQAIASNGEEIAVVPQVKELVPLQEAAPAPATRGGGIGIMSVVPPGMWKPAQGGWKKYTRIAYDMDKFGFGYHYNNSDDYYGDIFSSSDSWHTLSAEGDVGFGFENENRVWKIWDGSTSDPFGYAIMKDKDLDGMYEFYSAMTGHASMQFNDIVLGQGNEASFLLSADDTPYDQLPHSSRAQINSVLNSSLRLAYHAGQGRKESNFNLSLKNLLDTNPSIVHYDRFVMALLDYSWENNTYYRNWVDDLYLERSAINNLQYEVVCKDGDDYLEANASEVLKKIKPGISFYNDQGGTDVNGNLYIGSTLQLDVPATAGAFRIKSVELRKKEGNDWRTINTGTLSGDNKTASIRLRSNHESKVQRVQDLSPLAGESGEYSLFVEMERRQRILIDYSPCISPWNPGEETQERYLSRARLLGERIAWYSRYRTRGTVWGLPYLENGLIRNTFIFVDETDVNLFNFQLENGEHLLYDGEMYSGPVPIKLEHYLNETITMLFYDAEAMGREQKVRISAIEAIRMYLDENGDGVADAGDTFLGYLHEGRYANSFFAPGTGKDGNPKQKLLKYDYVKVPRKIVLSPADDPEVKYDLRASFMTTAVSDNELEKYTAEMKVPREINTGDRAVPIYGAEAARGSITVPLGGDYAPPFFVEGEGGGWEWNPSFKGNLKEPFASPVQVTEYATVVGNKTIPGEQTNDYLGSFRNTDQVILNMYDDKGSLVDNYNSVTTYREPVLGDFVQEQELEAEISGGDDNSNVNDTPGAEKPKVDLPDINMPAGPFKVVLEGNRAGFELGIPLFGGGNQKPGEQDTGLLGPNRSKYLDDMKDAVGKGEKGKNIFDQLKKAAAKEKDQNGNVLKPKGDVDVSFKAAFSASFMWEYSDADAQWYFDEARIFVSVHGEVKISQRLPPVPIIYVYIIFSGDIEIGLNIDVDEITDDTGLRTSEVKYSGELTLKIEVEAGVGVGVELAKFEIFLKVNLGLTLKIYAEVLPEELVDEFSIGAAVGFRVVFLCFSYEMDLISFKYSYELKREPEEWVFEWAVCGQDQEVSGQGLMGLMTAGAGERNKPPGVRLYLSGRTFGEQYVGDPPGRMMLMSIPTPHGFELGEYNEGASAERLADNLRYSSDYKLFAMGEKNYILYMIDGGPTRSSVDADMLVLSEIGAGGLIDPSGSGEQNYTVVDRVYGANDPKGDSAFDLQVDGTTVKVAWVDYQVVTPEEELGGMEEAMKGSAANTQIKYAGYRLADAGSAAEGFPYSVVLGTPDNRFNFLPRVTTVNGKSVVLSVKAEPYTEGELSTETDTYKANLLNQLNAADEAEAKSKYPYFDFKVGNFKNMAILYGKHSTFSFAAEKADDEFEITEIVPTDDWKNNGTRIEQAAIYNRDADEFYMAYVTSYNYLHELTNMTAKNLYLRRGTIEEDGKVTLDDPLKLRSLVDSDDNTQDGIYEGGNLAERFIDPFFSGLEFLEGKLDPDGAAEPMLIFNMNNRYYIIDEENLGGLINEPHTGTIRPFFELENDAAGDSKADFSLGVDGDGNISAVYTSPVSYTDNNAVFLTKYDPHTGTWGKGIMLAMRDMNIHEKSVDEGWSGEETAEAYYNSPNGDAKLVFQKPRVVVGEAGSLLLVAQTALTELIEVTDPMSGEKIKIPVKDEATGFTKESEKGFYSMSFPVGTRRISSPSLLFDHHAFVSGAVLSPRISFKNVGDFALRGSQDKPLKISLVLGNGDGTGGITLAGWDIFSNIPSGETVDTLLDSGDSVYGQVGTQILADPLPDGLNGKYLYFTVREHETQEEQFTYSSLDTNNPQMEGISYYSTDQDKTELVLETATIRQGGEIVTIGGTRYVPLDITAMVKNYSQMAAEGVSLKVEYRQTDVGGEKSFHPVIQIGSSGTVSLGAIAPGETGEYSTDNSDYLTDEDGSYIIQTDGTFLPNTANDLLLPLSCFDSNAKDGALELRFEVTTGTPEFETSNNIAFARLSPLGSIKMAGSINLVPNTPGSFPVKIESSSEGAAQVKLMELPLPGREPILISGNMNYDSATELLTIEAADEGETVLRVADGRTAAFKDVIVKAVAELPSAPGLTNVLPRHSSAIVYFDPPGETGGVLVTSYRLEAQNINNETDKITKNSAAAGRYEFSGLTNGRTYRFRVAAVNAAGQGPWSAWSDEVTPAEGDYNPLDAEVPRIISQKPEEIEANIVEIVADLGEAVSLEIEAEVNDGGELSYRWYRNATADIEDGTPIAGATSPVYMPPTTTAGTSYYYCIVTNTNVNALDNQTATTTCKLVVVTVGKGVPVIIFNASGDAVYKKTVTLTAEVGGLEGTPPTGTMRFEGNNTVLADLVPIENGTAVFQWEGAPAGEHNLQAVYYGDENYGSARSDILTYDIAKADQDALEIKGIPQIVTYGSGPYTLEITGGSGSGAVTYTITGDAINVDENGTVTILKTGRAIITANKAADQNYNEISAMLEITVVSDSTSDTVDSSAVAAILTPGQIDWTADPIHIDLSLQTKVSMAVIRRIAEMYPHREIVISGNGYSITFAPGTMREIPGLEYIDFGITLNDDNNRDTFLELTDGTLVASVNFKHSGELPAEAKIKMEIGKEYAGQILYYYYYNQVTGELEYMQSAIVDEDGFVTVSQSSCSEYVFTTEKLPVAFKLMRIPLTAPSGAATIPYYLEDGAEKIVKFSAVIGNEMHLLNGSGKDCLIRNNAKSFTDTTGHWAEEAIAFVAARELFSGTGEGRFSPDASMTRGMLVTVLGRLWDVDTSGFSGSTFSDVDADAYYASYVQWAAKKGIVSGIGNNRFAPDRAVTREEMAVILANFTVFTGLEPTETNAHPILFADDDNISSWAKKAVDRMQKAEIISGRPQNLFDPAGTATRAEVAAVLKRLIVNIVAGS